jgi:pyridoxamine 5'-phosphate oxidase
MPSRMAVFKAGANGFRKAAASTGALRMDIWWMPRIGGVPMSQAPADLRRDYDRDVLLESEAAPEPLVQFARWFEAALAGEIYEPNAMALSTVAADGRPSTRMVLLKGFDADGFVFYTNLESRKALELAANPRASLLFWWDRLHRQVRIEGTVTPVEDGEADAYFASRPYGSRIGALASPQSRVIAGRAGLEASVAELAARHPEEVPRPRHWGGYRLRPTEFEFWQGRPSRLHDRLRYSHSKEGWLIERLAP